MKKNMILWADDDVDDLQMMREILHKKNHNFHIREVKNGREALDYLLQSEDDQLPCLIILDINMPILDGKEALSAIKKDPRLTEIPVVVFTTSASELDKMFCHRHQTKMITKPPTYKRLEEAVFNLLENCKKAG